MGKCRVCEEKTEWLWAWQPFGPSNERDTFCFPGGHYRGFPVVKVCDGCRHKIEAGDGIRFKYKGAEYFLPPRGPIRRD